MQSNLPGGEEDSRRHSKIKTGNYPRKWECQSRVSSKGVREDVRLTPPSWGSVAEASEAAASAPRASRAAIIVAELLGE